MTPLRLSQCLLEAYDYASTDIKPPAEIADVVLDWGRLNIPDDALHTDEDNGKGRERRPHITVKYGLLARELPAELRAIAKATPPFPVVLGRVSLFRNDNFDVVKLEVESPGLRQLNQRVSSELEHEDAYPTYNPHLTLAYVECGTCDHLEGEDIFAAGMNRAFMASGMEFSGPGAEDDPARVREMLLFSQTKHPGAVTEAVLAPGVEDIQTVIREIATAAKESNGDVGIFVALANEGLADYGVRFADNPLAQGSPAYADEHGITLRVPSRYDINDPRWPASLYSVLHHEAVHVMQIDRSPRPDEMSQSATDYVVRDGRISPDHYLQQKQEIMAWAASMVDSWRRQGLTTDEMLQRLRSGNWGYGMKYWTNRKTFPEAFQRYCAQAKAYIDLLRESVFAETATPFDQCGFPAEATQLKDFIRRADRKRREQRQLL